MSKQAKVAFKYMFRLSTIVSFKKIPKNYAWNSIIPKIQSKYNMYLQPKHQNNCIYARNSPNTTLVN